MKNYLQNLLIFFAVALCVLIAFQWVREGWLRRDIQSLTNTAHDQAESIQRLQGSVKISEAEIVRLDDLKTELTATLKTNRLEIIQLKKDLEKAGLEADLHLKQIENFKSVIDHANISIKKQNETLKQLAEERNESVIKYNKLAQEYNELAKKWNDLQNGKTNTVNSRK